jgi:hypothetical protein
MQTDQKNAGFSHREILALYQNNAPPLLQDNLLSCNQKTGRCAFVAAIYIFISAS